MLVRIHHLYRERRTQQHRFQIDHLSGRGFPLWYDTRRARIPPFIPQGWLREQLRDAFHWGGDHGRWTDGEAHTGSSFETRERSSTSETSRLKRGCPHGTPTPRRVKPVWRLSSKGTWRRFLVSTCKNTLWREALGVAPPQRRGITWWQYQCRNTPCETGLFVLLQEVMVVSGGALAFA
jgi:hypothetical protein